MSAPAPGPASAPAPRPGETGAGVGAGGGGGGGGGAAQDRPLYARKLREAALVLPILGVVLLMPPVASLFATDGTLFGVPVLLVYVTIVWAGLILGAALLARRLSMPGAGGDGAQD